MPILRREKPEDDARADAPGDPLEQGGPGSGGQSGDTQGLSQTSDAGEETVEELAADGQDYEAGIKQGVDAAADHPERPVPSHERQQRRADASPGREPE
jgi:hypothetical protein